MADNKHARYIVAVTGCVVKDDRYLIIERGEKEVFAGALDTPGGGLETTEQASGLFEDELRREILEETGVIVGDEMHYLFSKAFTTGSGKQILAVVFLCFYASGTAHAADPDEIASVAWMTVDEVRNDPRTPEWTIAHLEAAEKKRLKLLAFP